MDTSFWAITLELFKGFWINFKLFGITLLCALPLGAYFELWLYVEI